MPIDETSVGVQPVAEVHDGSGWDEVRVPWWFGRSPGGGMVLVIAGSPTMWPWRVRQGFDVMARSGRAMLREREGATGGDSLNPSRSRSAAEGVDGGICAPVLSSERRHV